MSIKEFMLNFFSIKGRVARFKYTIYTVVMWAFREKIKEERGVGRKGWVFGAWQWQK